VAQEEEEEEEALAPDGIRRNIHSSGEK